MTPGWRLSELLEESTAAGIPIDITVVIGLLRQLLPAVALYGRHNRDAAIGALAVERLIVTPQARLVIAEHAFGPALEKLNLGRDKLWRDCASRCRRRPACRARTSAPMPTRSASSRSRCCSAASSSAEEYPSQLQALVEGLGNTATASCRRCRRRLRTG